MIVLFNFTFVFSSMQRYAQFDNPTIPKSDGFYKIPNDGDVFERKSEEFVSDVGKWQQAHRIPCEGLPSASPHESFGASRVCNNARDSLYMRAFARQTYTVAVVHKHNRPTACMFRVPHLSVGDADNRGLSSTGWFLGRVLSSSPSDEC